MTQQYRFCASAYKYGPFENGLHTQLLVHVSSPSTTSNEGGGWVATGPFGQGITFSDYVEASESATRAVNRALVADNSIFYLTGDNLFKLRYDTTPPAIDGFVGNTWNIVHTFTGMEAGRTGRNTGIYNALLATSGSYKRYVVGAYNSPVSANNTWKGWRYDIDTGVTSSTDAVDLGFNATGSTGGVKAEIFHNNKLYFIGATDGGIGVFDPTTMIITTLTTWPTSDIWGPHDFCPYKGKLYCLNRGENGGGGGSGIYIWEVARPPVLALNAATLGFGASSLGSESVEGRCILFTDKEYLYAGQLCVLNGTDAYRFLKIGTTSSGTLELLGSLPTVQESLSTLRSVFFTEQNSHPDIYDSTNGQLMTIMVDTAGISGCNRRQFAWVDPNSPLFTEESVNPILLHTARETAHTHVKNGGGERIWSPFGGPRVDIVNCSIGTSRQSITIHYKISTNTTDFPNGTPCSIQLKHDTNGHMPFKRGILSNPSAGTLRENNTVLVTTATSGTISTFEWDYGSDNILVTQFPNINLLISTTGVL